MSDDIQARINEITPQKVAVVTREFALAAGQQPYYVNLRQISPLDVTVGFHDELAAYKAGFAYREHWQSRVTIEKAVSGDFLVVLQPDPKKLQK